MTFKYADALYAPLGRRCKFALNPLKTLFLKCTHPMLKTKVEVPDDLNPQETAEWVEALDEIIDQAGPDRASYLLERLMERAANLGVRAPAALEYSVHQHDSARRGSSLSGRPRHRAAHQESDPLERDGHGGAGQQIRRQHRRPHLHLRLAGDAARSGLQPFLPRVVSGPMQHAGDFVYFQGHASPGVYAPRLSRRPPERKASGEFPPRAARSSRACRPIRIPG